MAGASVINAEPRVKKAGAGVTQAGVGDFKGGGSVIDEDADADALARISSVVEALAIANFTKFAKWLTYTGGELGAAAAAKSFDELASSLSSLSSLKFLLVQTASLPLLHNRCLSGAATFLVSVSSTFSGDSTTSLQ